MVSKWVITYNLLINGVYWGYNPFTNHLLTNFLGHSSEAMQKFENNQQWKVIHPQTGWKIFIFNRRNIFLEVSYPLEVFLGRTNFHGESNFFIRVSYIAGGACGGSFFNCFFFCFSLVVSGSGSFLSSLSKGGLRTCFLKPPPEN